MRLTWVHLLVLLLVVLLLFGARRLPDLARSVGQSLKIMKKEVQDLRDDPQDGTTAATAGASATPTTTTAAPAGPTASTVDAPVAASGPAQDPDLPQR